MTTKHNSTRGVMEAQAPRWHEPTLQAVLRGLRSEEQTVQIRAAMASVEAMLSDGVPASDGKGFGAKTPIPSPMDYEGEG